MQNLFILVLVLLMAACTGTRTHKAEDKELENEKLEDQFIAKGKEIAGTTQTELLKAVQEAMAIGGPTYAIDFCNLEALQLKDSLSVATGSKIQRLSMKFRNPADKPQTKTELEQLKAYQTAFDNGEPLAPKVHFFDDRVEYYQPIKVAKGACLLCHGNPETQIAPKTIEIIKDRYPNDLATGYALNDFRGVWKITFEK